jgi:hypothetical protein
MNYLNKILAERSTWDGVVICGCCAAVILFGGLAKMAAWGGLLYGAWTLLTPEK